MTKNLHKENLRATRRYRAIPSVFAFILFAIGLAVAVPSWINKSFAWSSGATIFAIIATILYGGALGYLAPYFIFKKKCDETPPLVRSNLLPVKEKYGPPRKGKSSSMYLEAQFIVPLLEFELKYEYWFGKNHLAKWQKENDVDKLARFEVIKQSYEFYDSHDYAWCVMSSLPCEFNGQKVLQLKKGHLLQELWAPRYTLWLVDEAGKFLPQQKFENRIEELIDTYREIGHLKFWCLYCEQREDNIQINVRSMTSAKEYITGQKSYCEPHLLKSYYEHLRRKALQPIHSNDKILAHKLECLKSKIDAIGFRVWDIQSYDGIKERGHRQRLYWTKNLDFKYNSECMFLAYKAKVETACDNVDFKSNLLSLAEAQEFFKPYKKPKAVKTVDKVAELKKILPELVVDAEIPQTVNIFKLCEEISKSSLLKKWKKLSTILSHYDDIIKGEYREKTSEEIKALAIAKNKAKAEAKKQEEEKELEQKEEPEDDEEIHCFD